MNITVLPFLSIMDTIEEAVAGLISMIARGIYNLLDDAGLTIDSLLADVSYDKSTAFFSLGVGNVYGVLGARLFVATRNIFLILVGLTFMFALLKAAAAPAAGKIGEAKMAVANVGMALLVVAWVPAVLNFFVWLRGFLLRMVQNSVMLGGNTSLKRIFSANDDTVMGAILYLAFACVGIYFAFFYICIAIMQCVMLGVLPIIALQGVNEPDKLRGWFKTFLGWMLIPMVDFVMFMVPAGLSTQTDNALVILVSMFALLPVRKFAFAKLGIEGADVAGIVAGGTAAALAAAGKQAAKGASDTVKKTSEDAKANKEDEENASLHEDLAKHEADKSAEANGAVRANDRVGGSDEDATSSSSSENVEVNASAGGRIEEDSEVRAESASAGGAEAGVGTENASAEGTSANDADSENGSPIDSRTNDSTAYSSGASGKDNGRDPEIDAIYQRHATTSNFDSNQFKGHLTHEQMADFYRQRKRERHFGVNTASRAAGQLGAAVGGLAGMGAVAMYGPGSVNTGIAVGRSIGTGAGRVAGQPLITAGVGAGMAYQTYRTKRATDLMGAASKATYPELSEAPADVPNVSVGSQIEPFELELGGSRPADYEAVMQQAVPESSYQAGAEAQQWITENYSEPNMRSIVSGIGSDLTESVAIGRSGATASVLDLFAGATVANGMAPAGMPMGMNFSTGYTDPTTANLMYGSVGKAQVATSYLRNADGTPMAMDAQALQAEQTKIREAAKAARRHVSVQDGQLMFSQWQEAELQRHRDVLERFSARPQEGAKNPTGFSYLNTAKQQMREQNNGNPAVISYRHTRKMSNGGTREEGRKFYNPSADDVVNRSATQSQERRAEGVERFFNNDGDSDES